MFKPYLSLLRDNRQYRYLWFGYVVSLFGDWFNLIASLALLNRLVGDTSLSISYLFMARFLTLFFVAPFAGVLADRYDRRKLMIVSDVLRCVVVLGFLFVRQADQVWMVYGLTVLQFVLSALFIPARTAVLANVVSEDEIVTATALDGLTWSTMLALGSLVGGAVALGWGVQTAFIIDGFTFLLSAYFIYRVGHIVVKTPKRDNGGWLDFVDGMRYLRGQSYLSGVAIVKAGGALIWGGINVIEIVYAQNVYPIGGSGDLTVGWLYAISGLGTGLGPLVTRRIFGDKRQGLQWMVLAGFVCFGAGVWLMWVSTNLVVFMLSVALRTFGSGTLWVGSGAILQTSVPDAFRGRVFAFEFAALTLMNGVSTYFAGYVQDNFGYSAAQMLFIYGIGAVLALVAWGVFHFGNRGEVEAEYGRD